MMDGEESVVVGWLKVFFGAGLVIALILLVWVFVLNPAFLGAVEVVEPEPVFLSEDWFVSEPVVDSGLFFQVSSDVGSLSQELAGAGWDRCNVYCEQRLGMDLGFCVYGPNVNPSGCVVEEWGGE